jgi:DNA-binding NtrC family response regulator
MAKNYRILIIDDSKETVAGLKAYLGKKYHILIAYNGRDGIKKFNKSKNRIHLVITDIIMPDVSGIALVSMIKKWSPETPVIAITGWGYRNGAWATETTADMVLDKPFEMEELDQTIEKLLCEIHTKQVRSMASFSIDRQDLGLKF